MPTCALFLSAVVARAAEFWPQLHLGLLSRLHTLTWVVLVACAASSPVWSAKRGWAAKRPNVLVAVSDDQSYPHASAYGTPVIQTPAFDRVARSGMLFHNAFTPAPGCSPMRAAFLTGQYIWQIREAGTHASSFPKDLVSFPEHLAQSGYSIGYTGKPWAPGNFQVSGRLQNPAGPSFGKLTNEAPKGISKTDYAANFEAFLDQRDSDTPFCFWYGGSEPHRTFGKGLGAQSGMQAAEVVVPSFLPDSPGVRSDLLDYFYEIQWFDQHLDRMLRVLEQRGELENTLVVVTSDNGMSFPRAKANLYEYGIHMPLAISWPAGFSGGRSSRAIVNLIDVTATIYDACELSPPTQQPLSGSSLLPLLREANVNQETVEAAVGQGEFTAAYSGRERHSSSRYNSLGYPCRCVRTDKFLYIRNFTPERWPAGAPRTYASVRYNAQGNPLESALGKEHGGYHDIDGCPTLDWMIEHRQQAEVGRLLDLAVGLRPPEELYAIVEDPGCVKNLVGSASDDPAVQVALNEHRRLLTAELERTNDLRQTNFSASHVWETYPRYSSLRWFPKPLWAEQSPQAVPPQPWLEAKRPRN